LILCGIPQLFEATFYRCTYVFLAFQSIHLRPSDHAVTTFWQFTVHEEGE
jgi:hypothetical protein